MEGIFDRTKLLLGDEGLSKLNKAHVAVFGVGGVGGYALEAIVRSGVGEITIIDSDTVSPSNINRQLIALHSNIGEKKIDVAEKRIKDINPFCIVHKYDTFFLPGMEENFPFSSFSYIVDAIDSLKDKAALILGKLRLSASPTDSISPSSHPWVPATNWILHFLKSWTCSPHTQIPFPE